VTNRRPSWPEFLRQAVALVCGLILAFLPGMLWAVEKSAQKAAPTKKAAVRKPVSKKAAKPPRAPAPSSGIGTAEIVESQLTGLHGSASYYGRDFHGRRTATGEVFDARGFTAASNRFPLGSRVAVRRLDNNRCAIVLVNDRMHGKHRQRVIDVSRAVAEYLDMIRAGVVLVRVAPLKDSDRDDYSCHAAFASDEPEPAPALPRKSLTPASPAQLDAMQ
jgi:rare lipoprotein A